MKEILVLTTVDSQDLAQKIASALVDNREAACVNILPGIRSIYRWEGKICDDMELLLIIKTTAERFDAVRSRIRALHTYQLPELIAVEVAEGDPEYLRWLKGQVEG